MASEINESSPWIVRFAGWMSERFQPANALLFAALYGAALVLGRAWATHAAVRLGWTDVARFASIWCFFLMLRVFDEHKDYELDCENHPTRVLQRGLVTLDQLKLVGFFAVVVQGIGSLSADSGMGDVTYLWFGVMAWSLLMAKEFFVGAWLEKRLVLYAFSHMLIMPLAVIWMLHMGLAGAPMPFESGLVLASLSFLSGAAFEVTRKAKGADEERPTIDSYSRIWGASGAARVVGVLLTLSTLLQLWIVMQFAESLVSRAVFAGILAMTSGLALHALWAYARRPTVAAREKNEAMVGLAMLLGYLVPTVSALIARGTAWG